MLVGTATEREIRTRILNKGKLTFAEFMEIALYHPKDGYYTRGGPLTDYRDFYTSPGAHPAFGALIAIQLRTMWELLCRPSPFYAVEMGAGSGILARDVVDYTNTTCGPFAKALEYIAIERLLPRDRDAPRKCQWLESVGVPLRGVVGCLLSNELIDSFPVHRFQVKNGRILEVYVHLQDGAYDERLGEPSTPLLKARIGELASSLPEGYRGEVNLLIRSWIREAAQALDLGFVLNIDYGYKRSDLYSPNRTHGTLETFYHHTSGASPYQRVGKQDMTAHIDFTSLVSEGESVGLNPLLFTTQAEWLSAMGVGHLAADIRRRVTRQNIQEANLMAIRELVKPDGLGAFKILVQEKNTGVNDPNQLIPPPTELMGPLLNENHSKLLESKYPHSTFPYNPSWFIDDS